LSTLLRLSQYIGTLNSVKKFTREGIESVCSLDYTSSFTIWSDVKTKSEKHRFQVRDLDDQLRTDIHRTVKGQREPIAQCRLKTLGFLSCVNEKKDFSLNRE
jgi:hypothetical protein